MTPKKPGNIFCVYLWTPGTSMTAHRLPDIGMDVIPGQAFECAPATAKVLAKKFPKRVFQVVPLPTEAEPKPETKKGGKK